MKNRVNFDTAGKEYEAQLINLKSKNVEKNKNTKPELNFIWHNFGFKPVINSSSAASREK